MYIIIIMLNHSCFGCVCSWTASVHVWMDAVVEHVVTVRTSSLGIPTISASVSLSLSLMKRALKS